MATKFDPETLKLLSEADEIGIRTSRQPDKAVIVWAVVVGASVFIRSFRGPKAHWYEAAATDGLATLEVAQRQVPVRVLPVEDEPTIEIVSKAYLTKYAASPYAKEMVRPEILPTTLRLLPQ